MPSSAPAAPGAGNVHPGEVALTRSRVDSGKSGVPTINTVSASGGEVARGTRTSDVAEPA